MAQIRRTQSGLVQNPTPIGSSGANFASTFVAITDSFQRQKASIKELEIKERALDLEARKEEREQMAFDVQLKGASATASQWDGNKGVPDFGSKELQDLHAEIGFAVQNRESDLDDIYIADRIGKYNQLLRRDQRSWSMTSSAATLEKLLEGTGEALSPEEQAALGVLQDGTFNDFGEDQQEEMAMALSGARMRLSRKMGELERRGKMHGEYVLMREQLDQLMASQDYLDGHHAQMLKGDMEDAPLALKEALTLMESFNADDIKVSTAQLRRDLGRIGGFLHTLSNQYSTDELNYYLAYQERLETERKSLQQRDAWAAWSFNGLVRGIKDGNLETLLDRAADGSLVMSPYQEYGLLHMSSASNHSRYDFTYDDAPDYVKATTLINDQLSEARSLPQNQGLSDNELLQQLHTDWMAGHRQAQQGQAVADQINAGPEHVRGIRAAGLMYGNVANQEAVRQGIIGHVNKRDRSRDIMYQSGYSRELDDMVNSDLSELFETQWERDGKYVRQLPYQARNGTVASRLPAYINAELGAVGQNESMKYGSFAEFVDANPEMGREAIVILSASGPDLIKARGMAATMTAASRRRAQSELDRRLDEVQKDLEAQDAETQQRMIARDYRAVGAEAAALRSDGPQEYQPLGAGAEQYGNPQVVDPQKARRMRRLMSKPGAQQIGDANLERSDVEPETQYQLQLASDQAALEQARYPREVLERDIQNKNADPVVRDLTVPFQVLDDIEKKDPGRFTSQTLRRQQSELAESDPEKMKYGPAPAKPDPLDFMRDAAKNYGLSTRSLTGMANKISRGGKLTMSQQAQLEGYVTSAQRYLARFDHGGQMDEGDKQVLTDSIERVQRVLSMQDGYLERRAAQSDKFANEAMKAEEYLERYSLKRQRHAIDKNATVPKMTPLRRQMMDLNRAEPDMVRQELRRQRTEANRPDPLGIPKGTDQ